MSTYYKVHTSASSFTVDESNAQRIKDALTNNSSGVEFTHLENRDTAKNTKLVENTAYVSLRHVLAVTRYNADGQQYFTESQR